MSPTKCVRCSKRHSRRTLLRLNGVFLFLFLSERCFSIGEFYRSISHFPDKYSQRLSSMMYLSGLFLSCVSLDCFPQHLESQMFVRFPTGLSFPPLRFSCTSPRARHMCHQSSSNVLEISLLWQISTGQSDYSIHYMIISTISLCP